MFNWMCDRRTRNSASVTRQQLNTQLGTDVLEDRTVPTVSAITSNFNGTAIPAGDTVWFSSVAKVSGLGATPATVHVTDQTISFTAAGTQYTLAVPDSTIVFDPATPSASAAFDGQWEVMSPNQYSGNVFLAGTAFQPAGGLPGGIKNVTWSGDFTSDTPGLKINWQWASAVYTQFSADPSALGVKAADAKTAAYSNSDHAGTPEAFKSFVVGGARGGGGSNFTGSYSGTSVVLPEVVTQPPPQLGSVSGFVYYDSNRDGILDPTVGDQALAGVMIHLTGTNDLGEAVDLWATTDDTGAYSFTGLRAGTYQLEETQPAGYLDGTDYLGSLGGTQDNDFFQLTLGTGQNGVNYNYTEFLRLT